MSGELRRLRALFRDELLVRVGRQYELTALARELVGPVNEIVQMIEQTVANRPGFDPATEAREFSLAMSDYAMLVLLEPFLARVQHEAPRVTLHVHPIQPDPTETLLGPGGVDLVITPVADSDTDSGRCQPLFVDRWVCAVSASHPEVQDQLTAELFQRLPKLSLGFGAVLRDSVAERGYRSLGVHGTVQMTTESFVVLPFLLSRTRMVALLQERLARRLQDFANIKLFPPPLPVPELREAMYWSAVADSDPAHRWLRRCLLEVAQSI